MSDDTEIKKLAKQKKLVVGVNSVLNGLSGRSIETIWLSSTVSQKAKADILRYAAISNVPVTELAVDGNEFGILCKRQFSISAIGKVRG